MRLVPDETRVSRAARHPTIGSARASPRPGGAASFEARINAQVAHEGKSGRGRIQRGGVPFFASKSPNVKRASAFSC